MLGLSKGGADTFVFHDNGTMTVGINNFIHDFSQAQHDKIKFWDVANVHNFADLHFDRTISGNNTVNTVIHAGDDEVTLLGFNGTLTPHDFLFA